MISKVDPQLQEDVSRLLCCSPIVCTREPSCIRVAKFAREKLQEMHAAEEFGNNEEYTTFKPYNKIGSWEVA